MVIERLLQARAHCHSRKNGSYELKRARSKLDEPMDVRVSGWLLNLQRTCQTISRNDATFVQRHIIIGSVFECQNMVAYSLRATYRHAIITLLTIHITDTVTCLRQPTYSHDMQVHNTT